MRLGELLVSAGVVTPAQVDDGLAFAAARRCRLGAALIELGHVDAETVACALAKLHGVKPAREKNFQAVPPEVIDRLDPEQARAHWAIPLGVMRNSGELACAVRDPRDGALLASLASAAGARILPAAASEHRLRAALDHYYGAAASVGRGRAASPVRPSDSPPLELADSPARTIAPAALAVAAGAGAPFGIQSSTLQPEVGPVRSGGSNRSARGGIAVAAAVIAGVAGFFAARHFFADKGEPVSGLHHSAHTGLELDFPDTGWLYLSKQDQSQSQQGVTARGVFFYRGDDPDSPEDGLALIAAKAPFPSAISDAEFDRLMGDMQQGVAQGISAQGFSVNSLDCERSSRRPGQLAECIGQGMYGDEYYDILFYFWIEGGDTLIIAAFLSKPPLDSLHGEIEAILPTIRRAP